MIEQPPYPLRTPAMNSSCAWWSIAEFVARASLVVVFGAACGCMNSTPPPASPFISAIKLRVTVDKCSPKNVQWNKPVVGSGILTNGRRIKFLRGGFKCDRETADRLVEALKGELAKGVEARGGRVVSSVTFGADQLRKAIERRVNENLLGEEAADVTGLGGFQIDYEIAAIHGQILVTATQSKEGSPELRPLNLAIDIYESR